MFYRLAIRAGRFRPEADVLFRTASELTPGRELNGWEKRGSFKGAIRLLLRSASFRFNDLTPSGIPRKSLEFRPFCFRSPPPLPTIPFVEHDLAISRGGKRRQ
jgi:hypothetical protein